MKSAFQKLSENRKMKTLAQIMAEIPSDERNEVDARSAEILTELDGLTEQQNGENRHEQNSKERP
jgi:hypothetical protein